MPAFPVSAVFDVSYAADPQAALRILGLFAQRALVPRGVRIQTVPSGQSARITLADADEHEAEVIAAKLREMPLVADVTLEFRAERVLARIA